MTAYGPLSMALSISCKNNLLVFRSKFDRLCVRTSNKLSQIHPSHPITSSSHRIPIDVTTITEMSSLSLTFGRAHRHKIISSLKFGLHGRIRSFPGQASMSETERHEPEELDREEGAIPVIAPLQAGKAARDQSWLQSSIPESLWPYAQLARIEKPTGTWLVAWPCFWSTCLAAPLGTFPDLKFIGLFGLWAFLMRSAACTVNDIFDRDLDGKVQRTKSRPFPSGAVTLVQGISFLGLQVLAGLAVISPFNDISRLLGAVFVPLFCIYPLFKRITYWPQAYLGLISNWGLLVAWAAIRGNLDCSILLPLHASAILWTLVYDTIYAHQDKACDIKIGLKSTALLFGNKTRMILTGFSLGNVALLALAGFNCGLAWPFYAGVLVAAGHLAWQLGTVNLDDPADCSSKFRSNHWYGAIVCSAIILGNLARTPA